MLSQNCFPASASSVQGLEFAASVPGILSSPNQFYTQLLYVLVNLVGLNSEVKFHRVGKKFTLAKYSFPCAQKIIE